MSLKMHLFILLVFTALPHVYADEMSADLLEAWENISPFNEQAPPPPKQTPFTLPRLHADEKHFNAPIKPILKTPRIDPDEVYTTVLACFPSPSTFNAELSLVGGFKTALNQWDDEYPDIADHYVGIIGKIPLYSANERNRQREREYLRRNTTAAHVSGFIGAIALRNQIWREIGLYRALEARAQARVRNGIAETKEQVTYLEKLTETQAKLITAQSKIVEYRLALAGLCENSLRPKINNWLIQLTGLKGES